MPSPALTITARALAPGPLRAVVLTPMSGIERRMAVVAVWFAETQAERQRRTWRAAGG